MPCKRAANTRLAAPPLLPSLTRATMPVMPVRVDVNPALLAWARERSRIERDELERKFPRLGEWESGDRAPTLKQLESFANATNTPMGYLLLQEPPDEPLPIPDFRTMRDEGVKRPSPDLLDTIFQCQQRQEWYRDYVVVAGEEPLAFVGSVSTNTPIAEAARAMREALGFGVAERGPTWTGALRLLIDQAEDVGVLVMVNGIVASNTHRKLDPNEFRGFALVDPIAPVVFVNGADTKAAQIFTLAHELAHVWLGQSALSDVEPCVTGGVEAERWSNRVAAEFLVPRAAIQQDFNPQANLTDELDRLARRFKVSTLVVLRRLHDVGHLTWDAFREAYEAEVERLRELLADGEGSGGNFYNTLPLRVSRRFATAVVGSTLEGQTLFGDAFQLLGFKKAATFYELASRLRQG